MKIYAEGRRTRLGLLFLVVYVAGACTSWQPRVESPADLVSAQRPDRVRLTGADGSRRIVEAPSLRGDSIVGEDPEGGPSAVALEDIAQVETRERDTTQTVLAVVLGGALIWLAVEACLGLVSPCGGGS